MSKALSSARLGVDYHDEASQERFATGRVVALGGA